jgi:hypothetical protein
LWATFEIATNEAEFIHTHFESNGARIFDRGVAPASETIRPRRIQP